ncbi:hypothetical protein B9Z65_3459 [Elsinoe australis]|uniref:Zn(2)-C6 fungal-type domain-containing protein n=1 Tax=Elsinoe australis TaxID=40998 RepID=A0A2P8A1J8_9PEZI|nr:hypothetical protein B9Z65_3459 [Elsinoe australis]
MTDSSKSSTSGPAPPLNKACEPCRALKVRCLPAIQGPSPICQRCLKFDRVCNYAPPHRKKQRKRTDARVAELEKEIVAMRALLEKSQRNEASSSTRSSPADAVSTSNNSNALDRIASNGFLTRAPNSEGTGTMQLDIVDRGLLTMSEAARLLEMYREEFAPHFPLTLIPQEQTAADLRHDQPLLFLAVMATASSKGRPELYTTLSTEVIQDYVSKVLINGQKSLEIVKAMNITCAWYHPTDRWSTLKFYEYSHLASTVAMDIGLGERDSSMVPRDEADMNMGPERLSRERKRTLLGCYAQCAGLSLNLRRPNLFHFSAYMADICREMETSPTATTLDKTLTAYVRIVNIGEEINVAFALSDGGREGLISDEALRQGLLNYQKKLLIWKEVFRPQALSVDLQIMYHHVRVVLHEIPLHQFYQPSLFRPPYFMQGPTNQHINISEFGCHSFSQCVASAHSLLDLLINQPLSYIRSLPCHIFPRAMYATLMLIAITFLPKPSFEQDPVAASGLNHEEAQAEIYLNAFVDKLVEAAGNMEYRVPAVFAGPLIKARKWFLWAQDRQCQGLSIDGGLTYGLFTGPDDHPAIGMDVNSDTSSNPTSSPGADLLTLGRSQSIPIEAPFITTIDNAVTSTLGSSSIMATTTSPSTAISNDFIHGKHEVTETTWMDELQQDYSTMLDPSLFEAGAEFGDLASAFQSFSPVDFTTGLATPDSIQAYAGTADFSSGMGMYTNLPGPMVRPHGNAYQGGT